jgi:hypothetical protein
MKLTEVIRPVTEMYRVPKKFEPVPITYDYNGVEHVAEPIIFNLFKFNPTDTAPAVFDVNKLNFRKSKKAGIDHKDELASPEKTFTPEFQKYQTQTGLYGWFSPRWNYYNIGIASKSDGHNMGWRTIMHAMQTLKPPTDDPNLFAWKPIQRAHTRKGPVSSDTVNDFYKNKLNSQKSLSDIKVVIWAIPNPGLANPVFKKFLENLETQLTLNHLPITNKETPKFSRVKKTISLIKQKISQKITDREQYRPLLTDLLDELRVDFSQLIYRNKGKKPSAGDKQMLSQFKQEYKNIVRSFNEDNMLDFIQDLTSAITRIENIIK